VWLGFLGQDRTEGPVLGVRSGGPVLTKIPGGILVKKDKQYMSVGTVRMFIEPSTEH
jgi:hypothetical protein